MNENTLTNQPKRRGIRIANWNTNRQQPRHALDHLHSYDQNLLQEATVPRRTTGQSTETEYKGWHIIHPPRSTAKGMPAIAFKTKLWATMDHAETNQVSICIKLWNNEKALGLTST